MGTLVAIDSQNLYHSARRALPNSRVDFRRLWEHIHNSEVEALCIVYLVRGDFDSSGFENLLRVTGYRISSRKGRKVTNRGKSRINYDGHEIRIALDAATRYLEKYDKFILISGDVDYSDLFSYLEDQGKKTEFWSFDRNLSPSVLQTVGKVQFLEKELLQEG